LEKPVAASRYVNATAFLVIRTSGGGGKYRGKEPKEKTRGDLDEGSHFSLPFGQGRDLGDTIDPGQFSIGHLPFPIFHFATRDPEQSSIGHLPFLIVSFATRDPEQFAIGHLPFPIFHLQRVGSRPFSGPSTDLLKMKDGK
jgi:hypothetical protein